jgi:drug/metabolite transporter (DMT)-like permease
MNHYLYYLLPIVGWSLPNFFIKKLRNIFDSVEIIVLLHLIYHIIILPGLLLTYFNDREKVSGFLNKIKTLNPLYLGSAFLVVILGLGAQYGFNTLLKYYDVTHAVPIIRAVSSILLVVVGYFIFKEDITLKKFIGIMSVVFGVYLITS